MANFNKAYKKTAASEGGYSNDPEDPGLETYCGISRRHWPKWPGWKEIDRHKKTNGPIKTNQKLVGADLATEVKIFYLRYLSNHPMMYLRKSQHELICVLRLSTDVLDIPGTVIADGNAATRITGFWPPPDGRRKLEKNIVFARYWVDQNSIVVEKRKRCKCAEVLVPTVVPPEYIFGAYVSCRSSLQMLRTFDTQLEVVVNPDIFFQ